MEAYNVALESVIACVKCGYHFLYFFATVAAQFQPGWYPFVLGNGQKLIQPTVGGVMETLELTEFNELILACRFDGKPKPDVEWVFNDIPLSSNPIAGTMVITVAPGRSVLIFDLENYFSTTVGPNELLGRNVIECRGDNFAQMEVTARATIDGESKLCTLYNITIHCKSGNQ